MRTLILSATLLFLAAFAALTIHAAWDRGFTILSVISLLIIGLMGIGVVGAIWEDPPDDE
ncbi:MAG TPA: hypothetical protein PKD63_14925 [Solirubrobacteraceae bacterium]|nr:hypothetical protein [Solirubrobacteraceae bacterium]